jgi:hypothetical protein
MPLAVDQPDEDAAAEIKRLEEGGEAGLPVATKIASNIDQFSGVQSVKTSAKREVARFLGIPIKELECWV